MSQPAANVPSLSIDVSSYPKLDDKQAGHLRHFYNLVSQPDGEWYHFGSSDPHNEFDDAARYQLATMTYAMAVAHFHRLPALKGPFKALMRRTIHKMLHPFVWDYWHETSQASSLFDPDLKELRKPWSDPVVKENIMYSGHLLLMTSLYAMLFDDDEFEQPGSLTFQWRHWAWGFGPQDFVYDNRALQSVILKQMEENGWVGVCCEPNAVFVVCNQFPIIAVRLNDVRDGTDVVSGVLEKYSKAISKNNMVNGDALYTIFFAMKQQKAIPARHTAHTAWANAFMNAWNSDEVRSRYEGQVLGSLTSFDGKTRLHPARVAMAFRELVFKEGKDPHDPETLRLAREEKRHVLSPRIPFETLNWGCFTMMLSELGKTKELNDLLQYADQNLQPTWENGGLFYPRNDQLVDEEWNLLHVEPHSGNAGIGYARLNVEDGQKKIWEQPWTREMHRSRPWVDGVTFADGVDFSRGVWDEEKLALIVTLRLWKGPTKKLGLIARNMLEGQWMVYVNGCHVMTENLSNHGDVSIDVTVGEEEVDVVLCKAQISK